MMKFPRHNLHIHSNFSDGKSTIKNIVEKSLKLDLEYIAITDHFTDSWKAGVIETLDSETKINEYLEEISHFQQYLKKGNKNLKLLKGIEIDLESSELYIKQLINPQNYDIILFEYLETLEGISFIKEIIDFWKENYNIGNNSPIFGLAHFDPSYFIHGALDSLINLLLEYDIYFEFNSRYPQYYSQQNKIFFQKLKVNNIPVAIGCDSHSKRRLFDIEEPQDMIMYYELQKNQEILCNKIKKKKNS